jgi:hypothetical protein
VFFKAIPKQSCSQTKLKFFSFFLFFDFFETVN